MRRIWWLAILGVLVACGPREEAKRVIASDVEYRAVLADARTLSEAPLKKQQLGEPLTPAEKQDLIRALEDFNTLLNFAPQKLGLYVGASKIHRALEAPEKSLELLQDALRYLPAEIHSEGEAQTIAEIYGELADASLILNQPEQAEGYLAKAVELAPKNVDYLAILASIRIQKKDEKGAMIIIDEGLKLAPNHKRLLQLKKLLTLEPPK